MEQRVIKFRFWLGHTKKMTYEHSLIDIAHSFWDFTEDIIPLQYTGLKDKNHKEIYEGDIVLAPMTGKSGYVFFTNGSFCWSYDMNPIQWENEETSPTDDWAEIIGNIYENKELLNKTINK